MSFLAHVRECALGALLVFLEYNGSLITTDGSRRIATMLQNTISFHESVPAHRQPEEIAHRLIPALQLQDLLIMVQRRVLQCFTRLIGLSHLEGTGILSHSNLLSLAITAFAEPPSPSDQSIESSITSSPSNFESLWELADNWGFGINGLVRGHHVEVLGHDRGRKVLEDIVIITDEEKGLDDIVRLPHSPRPTKFADDSSYRHLYAELWNMTPWACTCSELLTLARKLTLRQLRLSMLQSTYLRLSFLYSLRRFRKAVWSSLPCF